MIRVYGLKHILFIYDVLSNIKVYQIEFIYIITHIPKYVYSKYKYKVCVTVKYKSRYNIKI